MWRLILLSIATTARAALMTDTSVAFSSGDTNEALEITVAFRPSSEQLSPGDKVYLHLPRLTRSSYVRGQGGGSPGSDLPAGSLELRPSLFWTGKWTEGTFCGACSAPFAASVIELELRNLEAITPSSLHTVVVDASNGIKAYCGNGADADDILIGTDASGSVETQAVESSAQIGTGCHGDCSGHGECDHCLGICDCDEGYGSPADITSQASADCSDRVCPWGRSAAVPTASDAARGRSECSDNGLCDRETGECSCFPPWGGAACDRRSCPRGCSGHGTCFSMDQLSGISEALPLTSSTDTPYGSTDEARETVAWDHDAMRGCVCDSEWAVGLGSGEVQEPQWFGPDCSLRHCPSGDDPDTEADETDCAGKAAPGGHGVGAAGNLCYVECSNKGVCQYDRGGVGRCKCFPGYLGENCATKSEFGGRDGIWKGGEWDVREPELRLDD